MWKDIVKTLAPVLGTALGGPFGGMATKFLAGELLGDENATMDNLKEAILGQSPDIMLKLKESDHSFKIKLKELNIQEEDLHAKDRQNARELATINMWPQIILSTIFIVGYFSILGVLFFSSINLTQDKQLILNILLGVLTAGVASIMQFWFGSSAGSKEKTAKLTTKENYDAYED